MGDGDGRAVAVIGAGPAGLYAAKKLAREGCTVALINRDIRPGGLAEYGIFFNKYKMKAGLRKQYAKILDDSSVHYFGGVKVGTTGPVTLADLRELEFDAYVVAVGAQGVKWIRVEGSHALGVYDAKQLVYHYNGLPPFSQSPVRVGDKLAVIGAGNVAIDITHWGVHRNVPEITLYVRRGPMERKYTDKELAHLGGHVDREALRAEVERLAPMLTELGQDPASVYDDLTAKLGDERIPGSDSVVRFRFACQARRVLCDDRGAIRALELDENRLYARDGDVGCKPSGEVTQVDADMLVFAVGDAVDPHFGLEMTSWGEYAVAQLPNGHDGDSYAVGDRPAGSAVPGWFVVGWARKASDGLVGKARQDAERGCDFVLEYLKDLPASGAPDDRISALRGLLEARGAKPITWERFQRIREVEERLADEQGLEDYRFRTNEEMLAALAQEPPRTVAPAPALAAEVEQRT